ncbi:S8 family serine peptidase [Roseateles sp.]|uniref:S8 family serine peptidase n=1 Tax=Roseateles sp. TaxID=1971397 RepID=UPI003BA6E614
MSISRKLRPASLAVLALMSSLALSSQAQEVRRSYIVQLVAPPVASYTGGVAGLQATKPAAGQRLDVNASDVQAYISYLETQQANVLASVNPANISHKYQLAFNGFAAMLTDDEARALKKNSGVANVSADEIHQLDTSFTPTFLGIDKPGVGLWAKSGGQSKAGEGIIIGMLDSGIWPESPSFADRVDAEGRPTHDKSGTLVYDAPPEGWKGECVVGEGLNADACNNKLIGIRHFLQTPDQTLIAGEFRSGRDATEIGRGGHGSHTASTAGGNGGVPVVQQGISLGNVSGMAPRARMASYKVCWGGQGCASSSTIAAVDAAIKDGVHVLNYSIGPTAGGGSFTDASTLAFLGASNAGIFVSASAGNSGPTANTPAPTANLGPWHASVGNSTHNRLFAGDVTLGNDTKLQGASSNASTAPAQLILAKDAGLSGANAANLALCFGAADGASPLLDPAKVAGKVLVCDRGGNALVNKSANGKTAGAAGVIIVNMTGGNQSVINAPHSLSTVHLSQADGQTVKNYLAANASGTAGLGNTRIIVDPNVNAPVMNGSSSRGPNVANANILKPDLTAPGTDILATVSPNLTAAERDALAASGITATQAWALYTGTSMSSPHVAGLAAVLKQQHPDWTPAMIKSALMTTAYDTFSDGLNGTMAWDSSARTSGRLPWGQGAGHVDPNKATDPGLVYDAGEVDYARFLCGINAGVYPASTCQAVGMIAPQNLNLASLTAGNVLGTQTLTRTVTNVGGASATYTAKVVAPTGFDVVVTPASFTIEPGAKQTYTVRLTRTTAPVDTWAYGSLTWEDGVRKVRSPLTVRGSRIAAIGSVYSEATTGSKLFTIGTGFAGALQGVKGGLKAATGTNGAVNIVGSNGTIETNIQIANACLAGNNPGVTRHDVVVPAGTMVARFATYDAETTQGGGNDLDIVVINGANTRLWSSLRAGSNEMVTITNPVAGTYKVCVAGYGSDNGLSRVNYTMSSWVVGTEEVAGNFKTVLPSRVFTGGTASVAMSWSGLAAGKRHLGALSYVSGGTVQATTLLEVNTNDPLPVATSSRPAPVLVD